MFIGLTNFFDQSGSAVYFHHGNSLIYAKCPRTITPSTLDFADKLALVHGTISILSATPMDCSKSMLVNLFFREKKCFPRLSIFISARILVSATNSRLWFKHGKYERIWLKSLSVIWIWSFCQAKQKAGQLDRHCQPDKHDQQQRAIRTSHRSKRNQIRQHPIFQTFPYWCEADVPG